MNESFSSEKFSQNSPGEDFPPAQNENTLEGTRSAPSENTELSPRDEFEKYIQKRVREVMEEKEILFNEYSGETGEEYTVIDFERLSKTGALFRMSKTEKDYFEKKLGRSITNPSKRTQLLRTFENMPVLSKKQWEENDTTPKPFFYIPENAEDALTVEKIKEAEFHLGQWEVPESYVQGNSKRDQLFLTKNSKQDTVCLNALEAQYSVIIYNKHFGDGYRDAQGTIQVRHPDTNEYAPLTTRILRNYGLRAGNTLQKREDGGQYTIQEALQIYFPNLQKEGLLTPEDFREIGHVHTKETTYTTRNSVSSAGFVTFGGVPHYVGGKFAEQDVTVSQLSDTQGGIFSLDRNGARYLSHTFTITPKEGARKTTAGYPIAGAEDTHTLPFSMEEHVSKFPDENNDEYRKRLEQKEKGVQHIPMLFREMKIHGIPIKNNDLSSSIRIAEASLAFSEEVEKKERFFQYVNKFKNSPTHAFDALSYGKEYAERLLDISEYLRKPEMEAVLEQYADIIKTAHEFSARMIRDNDFERASELRREIREAIIRRAKDIINVLWELSEGNIPSTNLYGERMVEVTDKYDALESLATLSRSVKIISTLFDEDEENRPELLGAPSEYEGTYQQGDEIKEGNVARFYHFHSFDKSTGRPVHVAVQLRPYGIKKERASTDFELDGEARINFLLDFQNIEDDFKKLENPLSESRRNALSIRLDREGTTRDDSGKILLSDAGRKDGTLSLDVGGLFFGEKTEGRDQTISEKLGRVISVGNKNGTEYYHNSGSFSKHFGDSESFAKIAETIEKRLQRNV